MDRKSNLEFKEELEKRTRSFASDVFRFLDKLPQTTSTRVIALQLGKSASSIGANYREANRAESRQDFSHKIQIALKEASESCYWMEVLEDIHPSCDALANLHDECIHLRNLLQSIVNGTRTRQPTNPPTHQPTNQL